MAETIDEAAIIGLDARGDGVTESGAAVASVLPGERVRIRADDKRAELVEIVSASPDRTKPICPWFGACGGCATQHMSETLYRDWKRGLVVEALARAHIEAEVGPLIDAHGGGRRRATFHARFPHGAPDEVGFMRARSHAIVAIDACPLFAPGMAGAIAAARALAADLRGAAKPLDIGVTATLEGLDVDLRGAGPLGLSETRKLVRTAEALDLARVSNHGAVVVERRPPRVAFGDTLATLPSGGFLQATEDGEARMAAIAVEALKGAKRVADLFCGAGAFALRLARRHEVFAADFGRRGGPGPRGSRSRDGRSQGCRGRNARPLPPPARRERAFRVRWRPFRSAARGGGSAGAAIGGERPAARRRRLLQCGDVRPRRPHPDRRRIPHRVGRAD